VYLDQDISTTRQRLCRKLAERQLATVAGKDSFCTLELSSLRRELDALDMVWSDLQLWATVASGSLVYPLSSDVETELEVVELLVELTIVVLQTQVSANFVPFS
jgi:hypothetical protein